MPANLAAYRHVNTTWQILVVDASAPPQVAAFTLSDDSKPGNMAALSDFSSVAQITSNTAGYFNPVDWDGLTPDLQTAIADMIASREL
jgi:hypothetical protein